MSEQNATDHPGTTETIAQPAVVIHETPRSNSGVGIVMALVLLVVVIGGLYLFNRNSQSETSKNDAVAAAADKVGDAASKVGDAANDAVDTSK